MISEDRSTACPLCGDVCHCTSEPRLAPNNLQTRSRFEPDESAAQAQKDNSSKLIDPEANDNSEEQFAASLESRAPVRQRFVVEKASRHVVMHTEPPEVKETAVSNLQAAQDVFDSLRVLEEQAPASNDDVPEVAVNSSAESNNLISGDPIFRESSGSSLTGTSSTSRQGTSQPTMWKQEVAARLDSYRARRKPKGPRYPSMRLKFEATEERADSLTYESHPAPRAGHGAVAREGSFELDCNRLDRASDAQTTYAPPQARVLPVEPARIIEFPRSYEGPSRPDELAEPVFDRPRILDAPEFEPPLPALGGIILETNEPEPDRHPRFELPLRSASARERILANVIDGFIVLAAMGLFAYIFFRMTDTVPPVSQGLAIALVVLAILWIVYDYLLMVYVGFTPGMRAKRLVLKQFDGGVTKRSVRRWRSLASILSLIPLGLGVLWCYLDEDSLCWHDRITNTHLVPVGGESQPAPDLSED